MNSVVNVRPPNKSGLFMRQACQKSAAVPMIKQSV